MMRSINLIFSLLTICGSSTVFAFSSSSLRSWRRSHRCFRRQQQPSSAISSGCRHGFRGYDQKQHHLFATTSNDGDSSSIEGDDLDGIGSVFSTNNNNSNKQEDVRTRFSLSSNDKKTYKDDDDIKDGDEETFVLSQSDSSSISSSPTVRPSKFTGSSSSSLFASSSEQESTTKSQDDQEQQPSSMLEREIRLTSIFERTLPIQASVLAVALAFVVYVGVSGGITDGSDRYFYDDEIDDYSQDYWSQLMPSSDGTVVDLDVVGRASDQSVFL